MKKVYRILTLISFLLIVGIIIFFVLKINPKIKTKIYKTNSEYLVALNTSKLDNKTTTVNINDKDYQGNLSIIYQHENFYLYYLSFHSSEINLQESVNAFIYLPNVSLFKYLTTSI